MGSWTIRNLVLSASVALMTLTLTTQSAPLDLSLSQLGRRGPDACGILGSLNQTRMTVADVQNCYQAIPFNRDVASSTFQTVYTMFNELYIFRDSALTPNLPLPFTSAPVDVIKELQRIGRTNYRGDYFFHEDIRSLLASLHDAHVSYSLDCYSSYVFAQPLNLYAPVIDGKQSIRVFKDLLGRGYEDCEVSTIDGKDALPYIVDWATDHLSYSKDGGVRLTQALATQNYDLASSAFILSAGEFAERTTLPESSAIEYVLQCPGKTTTLRDVWRVLPQVQANFTDVSSFVASICTLPTDTTTTTTTSNNAPSSNAYYNYNPYHHHHHPTPQKSRLHEYLHLSTSTSKTDDDDQKTDPTNGPSGQSFNGADFLGAGNATVYYHLKSQPKTGVIVVWTHEAESGELDVALKYLDAFHALGVTNLIFDFQGNGGGSVDFASFLVQLFFPNKGPLDKSLNSDLRVSTDVQDLSKIAFNSSDGGLFNAAQYVNLDESIQDHTLQLYTNDDLFAQPVGVVRNGRSATYTPKTSLGPTTLPDIPQLATYPWTNNPANFRILSDGRCGSACTLSAFELHETYKVEAYSIGGVANQPLSIFSFAGGAVGALSDLETTFQALNLTSESNGRFLEPLPYKGDVRLPILEVYADASETVPLEYDAQFYAADHHLDFDAQNARSRDVMWSLVASDAWSS